MPGRLMLAICRLMFLTLWAPLTPTHGAECDKYLPTHTNPPKDTDYPYTKRGTRCEGVYAPGTSPTPIDPQIVLVGVVTQFPANTPETDLVLHWSCGEAHVRALATNELFYRMDVQTTPPYQWPTEILRNLELSPRQLATVAIASKDGAPLYCPVRLTTARGDAPTPSDPMRIMFRSAETLDNISASLLIDGTPPIKLETVKQTASGLFFVKIPRGRIPSNRTAVLRMIVTVLDNSQTATPSAHFILGPDA